MRKTTNLKNVIDIEASGLSSASYPIEIGVVLDNGDQYQSLIAPLGDWVHWDQEAEKLHGISRGELIQNGRSLIQVCHDLNNFCQDRTLLSDCWVLDNRWLNTLFWRAGIRKTFSCSPLESAFNEEDLFDYQDTKLSVESTMQLTPHRALSDALVIQQAIFLLNNHALSKPRSADAGIRGAPRLNIATAN